MTKVSIFDFDDLVVYLNALLDAKKQKNSRFSLRAWAKKLNYQNPSFISQVLKGERQANIVLVERVRDREQLDENEWRHLKILYIKSCQKEQSEEIFKDLLKMNQPLDSENLSADYFEIVSEWYYLVIIEMTYLEGFESTAKYISEKIRGELNEEIVSKSIARLKKVGILEEINGRLKKSIEKATFVLPTVPNQSVRLYHRSVLEMAAHALDEQDINERDFRAGVVSLKKDQVKRAKQILDEAHREIQKLNSDEADCVYQLNTQLFQMTKMTP